MKGERMSKSITKQAFWAVFAALFAALMALALAPAPSTAYASDLTAGGVSAQANPVKLVVFENNELAARTFSESTKVKKTYSQSDLEALAAKICVCARKQ